MASLDVEYWRRAVLNLASEFDRAKDRLCELDAAIGDGDHGVSMASGFREATVRVGSQDFSDIGSLLDTVGSSFVSTVGGVTGVIFGAMFIGAGRSAVGKTGTGPEDLAAMFGSALDAVKSRGKASEGDKSMIDALAPAVRTLRDLASRDLTLPDILSRAAVSAAEGAEATRDMTARVGRARYQGEKAIGHVDPGAASVVLIFEVLASTARNHESP